MILSLKKIALGFFLALSLPASAEKMTAAQVVDKATLKMFVHEALAYLQSDPDQAMVDFRMEGPWRSGSIYLFIQDEYANMVFHAFKPELEGTSRLHVTDSEGTPIGSAFVRLAKNGGGYHQYRWQDPQRENSGVNEGGSALKVTYVSPMFPLKGQNVYLASGIYVE